MVGGRGGAELVGVAGGRGVGVVAVRTVRRAHRVDARRVEVEVVEQRPPGLQLVALGVVGGDEPLVAPPDVDPAPVDGVPGGGAAHGLEQRDADAAAGQHDGRPAAQRLRVDEPGEQPGGGRLGQDVGVAGDDERGRSEAPCVPLRWW